MQAQRLAEHSGFADERPASVDFAFLKTIYRLGFESCILVTSFRAQKFKWGLLVLPLSSWPERHRLLWVTKSSMSTTLSRGYFGIILLGL